mmetsp:Transcript_55307/g.124605  ORF Transcript_55307/g.124605 Transcript_55307/m.124605 type:complete len:107 (+) Transcript_55307:113-433(+)
MSRQLQFGSSRAFAVELRQLAPLLLMAVILIALLLCPSGRSAVPPEAKSSEPLGQGCTDCSAAASAASVTPQTETLSMLTLFVAGVLTKGTASLLASNQVLWMTAA